MPGIDLKDKPEVSEVEEMISAVEEGIDPKGEDEESAEQREEAKQKLIRETQEFHNALDTLGRKLEAEFRDFADGRSRKEQEWISAILQHDPPSDASYQQKEVYEGKKLVKSKNTPVNITRQKVNSAVARMVDIQFPLGGDHNFHIASSSDPDLEQVVDDPTPIDGEGSPSVGEVASLGLMEAMDQALRMELKIRDQLSEAEYGRKAREAMRDWAMLGTAILKGPTLQNRLSKEYTQHEDSDGGFQSELITAIQQSPIVERVDPRFFYPDPEALESPQLTKAHELHPMNTSELVKLSKNEAFMGDRIRKLLELSPDGATAERVFNVHGLIGTDSNLKSKYLVKEYHGPIPKDVLKHLDVGVGESEEEDSLIEYFGEVWYAMGTVIRVSLSHIDADDTLPYQIVYWEKDDLSLFGHGMPYMMKHQATVAQAAWKMLLDNSGLSAGPQLVVNSEMVAPYNGDWDIQPFKIWTMTEYGADVRQAFQFIDIPNNQEELAAVIEMALQFADMESASPMIQQHTVPQANNASGLGLVLTEANVTQRELSMRWDRYITVPLIKRFYHYNMQYDDDPSIKGNFDVIVGGATERIDAQIIAQDLERILGMAAQSEEFMLQIDPQAAFRKWVSATRVGPEIMRSIHEVEAEKQAMQEAAAEAPPDPESVKAEAAMITAQARLEQAQADKEKAERMFELDVQKLESDQELKTIEVMASLEQAEARLHAAEAQREYLLARLASEQNKTLAQIKKDLDVAAMSNETQRLGQIARMQQFREQLKAKKEFGTGVST